MEDISIRFYDRFAAWTAEFKRNIALFGLSRVVPRLVENFPEAYVAIVDVDPENRGRSVGEVPVMALDDYVKKQAACIIITDIRLQYTYLDLIYREILSPAGWVAIPALNRLPVRYNYHMKGIAFGNDPRLFDREFLRIRATLPMECTLPADSLIRLMDGVRTSIPIAGDILEIGTGLGGSTFFMASVLETCGGGKTIYSVDSFEKVDYIPDLNFGTVAAHLRKFPFVKLVRGHAPEALRNLPIERICFCFIDCYAFPDILEYVFPRLAPGGMILLDNYNHGCDTNHGMPIADLFFRDRPEKVVRVGGSQGLVVKQA